jgi:hypothetical protein
MSEPKSYAFLLMKIHEGKDSNLYAEEYGIDNLFEEEMKGISNGGRNFYSHFELFEFSTADDREIALQLAKYVEFSAGFENNNYVGIHYKELSDDELQTYRSNH